MTHPPRATRPGSTQDPDPTGPARTPWWDPAFLLLVAAYFATQALIRMFSSPTLELDEAELMLQVQSWKLGYGPQPPLYVWLQKLTGIGLVPFTILKNALLALTLAGLHRAAWQASGGNRSAARLAAAAAFLIPELSWHSQNDRTHTILAIALAAWTLAAFERLLRQPSWAAALATGLLAGAGLLAKHSFILFLIPLLVAGLLTHPTPQARGVPAPRLQSAARLLAVAGMAAIMASPVWLWIYQHPDAGGASLWKLQAITRPDSNPWLAGLRQWLIALLMMGLLPLAAASALLRIPPRAWLPQPPQPHFLHAIRQHLALVVVILGIAVASGAARRIKNHWILPATLPLAVLIGVAGASRAPSRATGVVTKALPVGLVALLAAITLRPWTSRFTGRPARLQAPLADVLRESLKAHPGIRHVVTDNLWIAGNLQDQRPDLSIEWFVLTTNPNRPPPDPAATNRPPNPAPRATEFLLVWDASRAAGIPESLAPLAGTGSSPPALRYHSQAYLHDHGHRFRLGTARPSRPAPIH